MRSELIRGIEVPLTDDPQCLWKSRTGAPPPHAGHGQVKLLFTNVLLGFRRPHQGGRSGQAHPDWRTFVALFPAGPLQGLEAAFEQSLLRQPRVDKAQKTLQAATDAHEAQRRVEEEHFAQFPEFGTFRKALNRIDTEMNLIKQQGGRAGIQRRQLQMKREEENQVLQRLHQFREDHPGPKGNLGELAEAQRKAKQRFHRIRDEEERKRNAPLPDRVLNELLAQHDIRRLPSELARYVRTGELTLFNLESRESLTTNSMGEAMVGEEQQATPCRERFLFPLELIRDGIKMENKNRLTPEKPRDWFVFAPFVERTKAAGGGRSDLASLANIFVGNMAGGWMMELPIGLVAEILIGFDRQRVAGDPIEQMLRRIPHPSHAQFPEPEEVPTNEGAAPDMIATGSVEAIDPGQTDPSISDGATEDGEVSGSDAKTPEIIPRSAN